jgi:hypothetical protein
VIASRPHDALVGLDAAIVELEDLGEEAALEYIEHGVTGSDAHRLDWVIETAEVTETPLFLQIARRLHDAGLLTHAGPRRRRTDVSDEERPEEEEIVDTPELERAIGGLDTREVDRASLRWRLLETWTAGLIDGHFEPELPLTRAYRRATVEALAALACVGLRKDTLQVGFAELLELDADDPKAFRYQGVIDRLKSGIAKLKECVLPGSGSVPVNVERELRLAAARGLQLRLVEPLRDGVRFPHSILQAYLASRMIGEFIRIDKTYLGDALKNASRELLIALVMFSRGHGRPKQTLLPEITDALRAAPAAGDLNHAKTIDTLVAALEIDCVITRNPQHKAIATELANVWPAVSDDSTVAETKLRAIARFGETARTITEYRRNGLPAYRELFTIARGDLGYRVRLAAAQELGAGGDAAFSSLKGTGMSRAASFLPPPRNRQWKTEDKHREFVIRAWLAPMLAGSTDECAEEARENLREWLDAVADERRCPLSLEVALAQGFKHAANRRPENPFARREARDFLTKSAEEMLRSATFWFTRLTLLQARCLWELPDQAGAQAPGEDRRRRLRRGPEESRPQALDADALVRQWLGTSRSRPEHPFVAEARVLVALALEKRRPERFLWIDESGVVTKIGARPPRSDAVRKHNLWIPPSVGWSALDHRAQRLVADVMLLLNLIEREGDDPVDRDRRMRNSSLEVLPHCLRGERKHLNPSHTVGMAKQPATGSNCAEACPFNLCPYPPKGTQPYRVELSEAFCRRQQVLLGKWWKPIPRRTARWQGALPRDLKRFWLQMEERARR